MRWLGIVKVLFPFWSVSLEHFVERKPLISEEWTTMMMMRMRFYCNWLRRCDKFHSNSNTRNREWFLIRFKNCCIQMDFKMFPSIEMNMIIFLLPKSGVIRVKNQVIFSKLRNSKKFNLKFKLICHIKKFDLSLIKTILFLRSSSK